VFFWHSDSPFSQWYGNASFTDEAGHTKYLTAEHYMMAEKARLMDDEESARKILAAKHPREVKTLGRKVKNWDEKLWLARRIDIVTAGNWLKFSQNESLKRALLGTGDRVLVEASPYDRIWGIGLCPEDVAVLDEGNWKGSNLLGKCLMDVRGRLQALNTESGGKNTG